MFCICEKKDADQLRGNHEADQCLCFRYIDSTIPLLSKPEIPSLYPSSVAVQPGLCRTRSKTQNVAFLITRLISVSVDKETNQGVPNLHLWEVATGKCLKAFIQKKVTYW